MRSASACGGSVRPCSASRSGSRTSPKKRPSRRVSSRPSVAAKSTSPSSSVTSRSSCNPSSSTPSGSPLPGSVSDPPSARSRRRRRVAGVAVAQPPVLDDGEEGGREAAAAQARAQDPVGLGEHLRGRLGVPRARLDEEAHHRAGRRHLEPLAADVADQQGDRAARQRPHAEDVAAADLVGDGLVDEAELEAGLRVRRPGHEAGGQRARDPPLVLELEPVGDRAGRADAERGQPPQVVLAEAPAQLVRRGQHAEQPPAERDRDVHERADRAASRSPSARSAPRPPGPRGTARPEAATRPIMPSPSLKRARAMPLGDADAGDVAQLGRAGVVARQQHASSRRDSSAACSTIARVDGLEVDRGGDRLQRAVEQALLAPQARLALEQLGALERQRREPREHLDRAQVLGGQRAAAAGWRRSPARRTCARPRCAPARR